MFVCCFCVKDHKPVLSMFMAPAVTPWFSTLPGTGSNNPGIRLYKYSMDAGTRPSLDDYTQYYINLTAANSASHADWVSEYKARQEYKISDLGPSSIDHVIQQFKTEPAGESFDRYFRYNSVSQDLSKCTDDCKIRQICAAWRVDYDEYQKCIVAVPDDDRTSPDHRHHVSPKPGLV